MAKSNKKNELTDKQQKNSALFKIVNFSNYNEVDTELHIERTFNFPVQSLYKAFTQAQHFQKWWGPFGSENSFCEINLFTGGSIKIDSDSAKGRRRFEGKFIEIIENEKLVFVLSPIINGESFFETNNTVIFKKIAPSVTNLSLTVHAIKPIADKAFFAIRGMVEGWKQVIDKLDTFLSDYFNEE